MENSLVTLRKADMTDKLLLFEWANDPECRQNSLNQNPIELSEHEKWLKNTLASADRELFICKVAEKAVGQVRIDRTNEGYLISCSVAKSARGKGIGRKIIESLEDMLINREDCVLTAIIKENNIGSRRIFQKLGYSEQITGEICSYRKCLKREK